MAKYKKKNPDLNWVPIGGIYVYVEQVKRAGVIVMFVVSSMLLMILFDWPLTALVEIFTQSILTAYYCYEYKTAAAGIELNNGILMFEQ